MSTKARPDGCCSSPRPVRALDKHEQDALVGVFRALGDPTRLEIFRLIAGQTEPICVCDVVDRFNLSQPTISHHLKTLREAGLVTVSRRGIWAFYAANARGTALLRGWLADHAASPEEELAAVG